MAPDDPKKRRAADEGQDSDLSDDEIERRIAAFDEKKDDEFSCVERRLEIPRQPPGSGPGPAEASQSVRLTSSGDSGAEERRLRASSAGAGGGLAAA
ncbi:hypothetical protein CF319_g8746 [Tilletia indica]|nr:hypothetical protein CF319_g8746 [Tilletia indica]